jgi:hypothetical protein
VALACVAVVACTSKAKEAAVDCVADAAVSACAAGGGYACAGGSARPDSVDAGIVCSHVLADPAGGGDDYCCIMALPAGVCVVDEGVEGACPAGSFGFVCTGLNVPSDLNAMLACEGVGGAAGEYCCQD